MNVVRYVRIGLTEQASTALEQVARRTGLSEGDALNVAIQVYDYLEELMGTDGELLVRRPDGTQTKVVTSAFGRREGK